MVNADAARELEAQNKALVRASFDAWLAGTGSPFDLLREDATWTINGSSVISKTYENKAIFMSQVMDPFHARLDGRLRPTVREIYAEGNTVIVFFHSQGTARDGQPFQNVYVWFLDIRDGKAVHVSALFDTLAINDLWQRVEPRASR